jgi:hypothetical protein
MTSADDGAVADTPSETPESAEASIADLGAGAAAPGGRTDTRVDTRGRRGARGRLQPAPAAEPTVPAGWYADPSGRYELRYWDGLAWTEHVSRAGQQFTDPPVA